MIKKYSSSLSFSFYFSHNKNLKFFKSSWNKFLQEFDISLFEKEEEKEEELKSGLIKNDEKLPQHITKWDANISISLSFWSSFWWHDGWNETWEILEEKEDVFVDDDERWRFVTKPYLWKNRNGGKNETKFNSFKYKYLIIF